ncbi:hypothetical protein WA026_016515 [Henosepilachna vigintioctopunctata]|uniref:Acidic fibroblast growth factor intracellular-binding protein n=1 Tax=Henosepilachna vigintioctopunctata TaxID=420089 RepID=A0AAW1VHI2_9CUCU
MSAEIDVFISNYTLVDPEIYELWVEGQTARDAVATLNDRGLGRETGASLELIASDVLDHYRTYALLEKLLINPNKLQEQLAFQIEPQTRQILIEKYYDFDDAVIRELLGKKLSSKHRKDLDEVAEKTGVPLKSCRRQFDNVKRIFKITEETPGPLAQNIQNLFYLPEDLARKYACIVFIGYMRFETTKRKLQYLAFSSWKKCAQVIMDQWTYRMGSEYYETEIDKEFLLELRELKVLGDKEKEHKHLVCAALKSQMLQKKFNEVEQNFRNYSRAILTLSSTLHRSRDMRNLFVDLSQFIDLWRQSQLNYQDLEQFLPAFTQSALEIDVLRLVNLPHVLEILSC